MSALLFVVVFALLLGAAQLLGWTRDSRDSSDWRPTDQRPPEQVAGPLPPRVGQSGPTRVDTDGYRAAA